MRHSRHTSFMMIAKYWAVVRKTRRKNPTVYGLALSRCKKAVCAAGLVAGLAVSPGPAAAGETLTYTGNPSDLKDIRGVSDSLGPRNLANTTYNTITVNFTSTGLNNPAHVYGAFSATGDVTGNTVNMIGGAVQFRIFAGYSSGGNATGNTVNMSGGTALDIETGCAEGVVNSNATNNTMNMSGGTARYIYGGISSKGNATGNTVTMTGGTVSGIYGGFTGLGGGDATGNTVAVSGGTVTGDVYGGYVFDGGTATGNTVTVSGSPVLANAIIYGGFRAMGVGDVKTGNTLNIRNSGLAAKGVENFQYYNFYLPSSLTAGGIMLSVTNGATISGATVGVGFISNTALRTGDTITLLHSGGALAAAGINTQASGLAGIARLYDFDLIANANNLYATVSGIRQNPQVKALSEGQLASAALLNQGVDILSRQGLQNARSAASGAGGQTAGFAAIGGGSLRYDTGSHIDVRGFSLLVGAARQIAATDGTRLGGIFLEAGWGNYGTYNDFINASSVRGAGDSRYFGAGWLGRWQNSGGRYLEGSLRTGRVSNKFNSDDFAATSGSTRNGSYDVSVPYYGLHIGLGREKTLDDRAKLDIYTKLLWTHQNGSHATVQGDAFDFASVDSCRWQSGIKWLRKTDERTMLRTGLAYQYEFGGKAGATVNGDAIDAPSMKGGAGIVEVGLTKESKDGKGASLDFGLQGFFGKMRGIAGNIRAIWNF